MLLCSSLAFAQTPLIENNFDDNEGAWASLTPTGKISITHEKEMLQAGKGALRFDYALKKGEMNVLTQPIENSLLKKAKAVQFWVKCDSSTIITCFLDEKGGGRYMANLTLPKGKWQKVEFAPEDFSLADGENDPKDPNNKLDMDQVERISIADLAQFFIQAEGGLAELFQIKEGARVLLLDEFRVTEAELPKVIALKGDTLHLETLVRPQISWIGLGAVAMEKVEGKPLEGQGLEFKYRQLSMKPAGVVKAFPLGTLTKATNIVFQAASQHTVRLIVQLEEKGGGKYNAMLEIPEGSKSTEFKIALVDFNPADDSKDANNRLDLDQVKQILFIDATAFFMQVDRENTLWINALGATLAK
jgi:hypothetical protein